MPHVFEQTFSLSNMTCFSSQRPSTLRSLALLAMFSLLAACSSLPTDFEKLPSYALEADSENHLISELQELLNENPEKSG